MIFNWMGIYIYIHYYLWYLIGYNGLVYVIISIVRICANQIYNNVSMVWKWYGVIMEDVIFIDDDDIINIF